MIAESMSREADRIAAQLRASYRGPAWHGPSLRELLEGLSPEIAARRPAHGHSIFEIAIHLTYWARVARRTIEGEPYPTVNSEASEDWREPKGSWEEALEALGHAQRALIAAIREMPDTRLQDQVSEQKGYTFYVLLHGVVQHNLYHAGQIAILKKEQ